MRSPFRDEQEAALARVDRLERENAELRAKLAAAHRSTGRGAPARPTLAIALSVLSAATVTGVVTARLPSRPDHTFAPSAATAASRADGHWRAITASPRTLRAAASIAGTIYLAGDDGGILRFGEPETEGDDAVPRRLSLFGIGGSRGHVFAVGERGTVLAETITRGWEAMNAPSEADLLAVATAGETVIAVGRAGAIVERVQGRWIAERSGTTRDLYGVARTPEAVYAVGAGGTILVQREGLRDWTEEPSGIGADLLGVFHQDGVVYAVGKGGAIVRRARDGWVREASGTLHDLRAVGGDGQSIYAVGAAGTVLRSAGAGVWRLEEAHTTGDLLCVAGTGDLVYAAGVDGTLLRRSY